MALVHGSPGRYTKGGCRCDRCVAAHREYQAEWRRKRQHKATPPTPARTAPPVRTYGEPWDSIIQAGAYYSQPPSGLPRNSDKIVRPK